MERRKAFDIENGFYAIIPAFINRGAQIGNFIRKIKKKIVLHPFTYETMHDKSSCCFARNKRKSLLHITFILKLTSYSNRLKIFKKSLLIAGRNRLPSTRIKARRDRRMAFSNNIFSPASSCSAWIYACIRSHMHNAMLYWAIIQNSDVCAILLEYAARYPLNRFIDSIKVVSTLLEINKWKGMFSIRVINSVWNGIRMGK